MLYFDQTNPYAQSLTFSDESFILFICKVLYIISQSLPLFLLVSVKSVRNSFKKPKIRVRKKNKYLNKPLKYAYEG